MGETELRRAVCRRAESWLGCREGSAAHRELLALYNGIRPLPRGYRMREDDPWCAAFVSAVGAALGLTAVLLPECGCEPMIALYRAAGLWEEADEAVPRPGDLIFYDWQDGGAGDCRGEADHVGLVVDSDDGLLTVIEGNLSHAVGRRRIGVGARFIRGFARPNYAAAAAADAGSAGPSPAGEEASGGPPSPAAGGSSVPAGRCPYGCGDPAAGETGRGTRSAALRCAPLPVLRKGCRGRAVRAAQLLLIARGFRCGPSGADGDFGPATCGAVYRFQQAKLLTVDGEIGPETWPRLIGELEDA